MAWRFEPGEELRNAFSRVAREEIDKVRTGLAGAEADRARAIHEARQGFKRLRALARLARPALGELFAAENRRWRDAGRLLSGSRDSTVLAQSFEKAVAGLDLDLPPRAIGWLRKRLGGGVAVPLAPDTEEKIGEVLRLLDTASEGNAALTWPDSSEILLEGFRQGQRRLRKSWKNAAKDRSPEALHEWRKRVKDQSAQLRLFRAIAARAFEALRSDAKDTAERLGEEHDLWLLSEHLAAQRVPPSIENARGRLLAAIKKRRTLLRRQAFKQGAGFSSRNARSFAGALGKAWDEATRAPRRKGGRPAEPEAPTSQAP